MIDLLKSHGWKEVRRNNDKVVFFYGPAIPRVNRVGILILI